MTTSYQQVTANATGSNPQGTITIQDYSDLEVNASATGQIVVSGTPTHYVSPIKATGSITIAGQANFKTDVFHFASTGGNVKFGVIPDAATSSDTTEFIQLVKDDGTTPTKLVCVTATSGSGGTGFSNGDSLTSEGFGANARGYLRVTDAEVLATNFANAITYYYEGWEGSVSAGPDPLDTSYSPTDNTALITG